MSVQERESAEGGPSEDQLELAQHLAALSETPERGEMPRGVRPSDVPEPFDPEEVDFTTDDWLDRISRVQAWLLLDAPLDPSASATSLAESVFRQLAGQEADACFEQTEGGIKATSTGYRTLIDRASLACEMREYFIERLEELDDHAAASKEWLERWEDDGDRNSSTLSVNAKVVTWQIYKIVDTAKEKLLELNPTYQRDIVWKNPESQKLIASILKGIPLPSVILSQPPDEEHFEIVDGKQRLTSILRFIGKHPRALDAVQEYAPKEDWPLFETDYSAFFTKYLRGRKELTPYLPFKLKLKAGDALHHLDDKYFCQVGQEKVQVGGTEITIKSLFLSANSPYQLPVIIYEKTGIRTIHDVFGLYNKQGKHLNPEELRNASYHAVDLTRLLIVLSGDRSEDAAQLAPYLKETDVDRLGETSELFEDLGFGLARFKRTKVLSWTLAIMLQAPPRKDGTFLTPSTAKHIDAMLVALIPKRNQRMRRTEHLRWLATTVLDAVELHSETADAWANSFRNKKGLASKWQELSVVASLLTTLLILIDGQGDLFAARLQQVRERTASIPPLEGAQNSTQWGWVAGSVLQVLELLDIDLTALGAKCDSKLGYNCLETLEAIDAAFPVARVGD